jgi:hypothetical protein
MTNQNRRVVNTIRRAATPGPVQRKSIRNRTQATARKLLKRRVLRRRRGATAPVVRLDPPEYIPQEGGLHMLGLHSFAQHMTDEGWQMQEGLALAGYRLWGPGYPDDQRDVPTILNLAAPVRTLIVQDKREWDPGSSTCLNKDAGFQNYHHLSHRPDIFKLTICKDAHQEPHYHRDAAEQMGYHGWIAYYHPDIVCALAPYIRREHLIRTWHSVDPAKIPPYGANPRDRTCLLSGNAARDYYPLRNRLYANAQYLPVETRSFPGYAANGPDTDNYLFALTHYKVAICTASRLGYALRKLIEATACGCRVITNLPEIDVLPEIEGNLIRISSDIPLHALSKLIRHTADTYEKDKQEDFAKRAQAFYDYRRRGRELAAEIERLRLNYGKDANAAPTPHDEVPEGSPPDSVAPGSPTNLGDAELR